MTTDLEQQIRNAPLPELDRAAPAVALAKRAGKASLLDVAYAELDSPIGELIVFVTPRGLLRVKYADEPIEGVLADVAARVSPRILRAPTRTDETRRQIEGYFGLRRRTFNLPIDWSLVHGFAAGVLRQTARIPFGDVRSYGQVAAKAGSPRAARATGNALGSNPIPIVVPCHRVLHADGGLGGYSGGLDRKRYLLALEGALPDRD
ncbi:MAG TPA: methylated-DNA--[protein]-cysteine S-methyltransferase [Candidatus Limnocylindria bacterium]